MLDPRCAIWGQYTRPDATVGVLTVPLKYSGCSSRFAGRRCSLTDIHQARVSLSRFLVYKAIHLLFFQQPSSLSPTSFPCLPLPSNPIFPFSSPVSGPTLHDLHSGHPSWTRRLHRSQNGPPSLTLSSTRMSSFTPDTGLPSFLPMALLPDP